ncbi:hypothetical protein AGABI2DRAFT_186905 [Agaricus bisporus var. bisporus H97]|uniref:hypothetical protein n=1 Tax=Agaricus bisporus var. bisporus (strain H97 / ATCC MYA-4626 / FGSC 10389) TaxID=936046 RepID=UPI00029F76E8|nr:hypothetical protein AGABI2DRAFT_186905 [Agaricus bisporus var. bisporus H97]EKV45128.1 hypothetical protein AGABI2DRAFT_186905 [Agaricus bisporus var. bisporus H97]
MPESSQEILRANQYGRPSFIDKIGLFSKLAVLPVVLVWSYLFKWSGRTRKRSLRDGLTRFLLTKLNIRQCQHVIGTTKATYNAWCKQVKQEPHIEAIGEVFHGGAFLLPPIDTHVKFWARVGAKLGERGINVSLAMLEYTLVPAAAFPTQLKQAVAAINHLTSLGVKPQDIQLAGDSAGANLILQVLSHLLHPLEYKNVPALSLAAPLKGAYLMSPWVDLSDIHGTFKSGDPTDILTTGTLRYWGTEILRPVPKEYLGYVEANSAGDDWWKGVDALVDRVLITAGREECLKDEIIRFNAVFENFHAHVKMEEHDGVHDDPLFAVELGESGEGAPDMIIDWFRAGY